MTVGLAGVTVMDCNTAGLTVSVVEPLMLPEVAVMVVCPAPWVVAKPELLIVATPVLDEDQIALDVMFCVLPSLKVPVAVNCWVALWVTVGLAGVTVIDCRAAVFTLSSVEPFTLPRAALMVVWPAPLVVAKPAALIVATVVRDEVQVTVAVMSWVVPSL